MKKSVWVVLLLGIFWIMSNSIPVVDAQAGPTVTELLRSGNNGAKQNLVIIGDGFQQDTAPGVGDQTNYNNIVDAFVMQGVFSDGVLAEIMNSFNIYRVNVNSVNTGVTQITQNIIANNNATGGVITSDIDGDGIPAALNTALGYEYSGDWNRCWMERGPNTAAAETNLLNALVPQWDFVFVILNQPTGGGCRRGNFMAVTTGSAWTTVAHEMGHMVGNLGDEYVRAPAVNYATSGLGEPPNQNLTTNTTRNTIKWGNFIDPNTPIPTACAGLDATQDAGVFTGGTRGSTSYNAGLFRPHCNDRMTSNVPAFGTVNYNLLRQATDPFHEYTFDNSYVGDFDGDGWDDLVLHNANSLALYVSTGSELELEWIATPSITNWEFKSGDKFHVGDFNGDGLDDLFVVNHTGWTQGANNPVSLLGMLRSTGSGFVLENRFDDMLSPFWYIRSNDQFYVADFDGDGMDDIFVSNVKDWSIPYLYMLRSTGKGLYSGHDHRSGLEHVKRYDDMLPFWYMKSNDQFYVGDIDGDGLEELYVFNGLDWYIGYLHLLKSTGASLEFVTRYDDMVTPYWYMTSNDQFYVADFDGDGDDDLYLFNGHDWAMEYMYMLRSSGKDLSGANRYDDSVPGWIMSRNDQWFVADIDGNGMEDLYVYNNADPAIPSHNGMHMDMEYLGLVRSTGSDLEAKWHGDWIGNWNLGLNDKFLVANFNGMAGWEDLLVRNSDWFGMLRSHSNSLQLNSIYPDWIHNHNFHSLGWW